MTVIIILQSAGLIFFEIKVVIVIQLHVQIVTKTKYASIFSFENRPPFSPYIFKKNMIGIKNPINEFVVAPRIVIASAIVGTVRAISHETMVIPNVHIKFCFELNTCLSFIKSSSKLSLQGRTQNGAAKRTTRSTPIRQTLIIFVSP